MAYVSNPAAIRELARSEGMRNLLHDVAERGLAIADGLAPDYSGPTWRPGIERHSDYREGLRAEEDLRGSGWRSQVAATAWDSMYIEFGTGRPSTTQDRPQHGHSPKQRVLRRTLDAMRI